MGDNSPFFIRGKIMKKLFLSLFLTALITPSFAQQCKSEEELKALVKNPPAMSQDEYEQILTAYSCCEIDQKKLDLKYKDCAAFNALNALRKEKVKLPAIEPLIPKLIKSPSPQVRAKIYPELGGFFGSSQNDIQNALQAIKAEQDLYAMKILIRDGIHKLGNKVPEVASYLKEKAKHENPEIRQAVARALASPSSNKVEGVVDVVVALMNDSEEKVAKFACSGAGDLGNEAVIEPIVAILNDASKAKLHSDCISALSRLWYEYSGHSNTSEKAYKANLDYWKKTPRTADVPAWTSFNSITSKGSKFEDWKAKATYFKAEELIAVLSEIIQDSNASSHARRAAIRAIAGQGGKDEINKLAAKIEALTDKDAQAVQKEYKTVAEKVNK